MDQSKGWGVSRYVVLGVVLAVHVGLMAALMTSPRPGLSAAINEPVQLLYLPPAVVPKVIPENFRPRRLSVDIVIPVAPPGIDPTSLSSPVAGSGWNGDGAGVDWKAEARRAVQAFDIRSHLPWTGNTLSASPAEETWWPRARRFAGTPFKMPNGDWIVWINSNCYQIATSAANASALAAMLPRTVCSSESGLRREIKDEPPPAKNPATSSDLAAR